MRIWLRHHRQAFAAALGKIAAQRASSAVSALVIGVALALPAAGYTLLESVRALTGRMALDPQLTVFLRGNAARGDVDALAARIKSDPRVAASRFVPREQALKELASVEGLTDVVGALESNPLPDAFVLRARDPDAQAIDALATDLRREPSVEHVQADTAWARRLAAVTRLARVAVLLLAGLLGFGLVAVTFNTIRLQILTQRDEIEVSKLIGATDGFIRRPFFYLGLLQGAGGGLLALAIVWGTLALLNPQIAALAASYGANFRVAFPPAFSTFAVLVLAAALGWLGAYLSVSRYLREIQPR
ncbi:MAG TPA: permease-like cell division protein FtsX [Burkholderiales bacterium]|nr:permease-like cell division protein FtsX [Burkholderiales bacterium]